MPRLNSAGSAVQAAAGSAVSIDGVVPGALAAVTAGGGWAWLSDDSLVGLDDAGALVQYVVSTATLSTLDAGPSTASVAGGGAWAVYAAATGVHTNIAGLGPLAGAGLLDASGDGALALLLGVSSQRGVRVYDDAGVELVTLDAILSAPAVRLRGNRVAYQDAGGWHLWDVGRAVVETYAARTTVPTHLVPVALSPAGIVVVERDAAQITLRRPTAALGYVVYTGTTDDPDAVEISPGVVRVAWSASPAALPSQLVLADVDVHGAQITIGAVFGGAIVWSAPRRLTPAQVPAATASLTLSLDALLRQRIDDPRTSLISRQWTPWFKALDRLIGRPVDLARVTGVLSQAHGGTGNTLGAVVNAFRRILVSGQADVAAIVPDDALTLVAGAGVTLTTNAAARTVTLTAGAGAGGEWSVLTDGDPIETELIFADGDVVTVWVPV